MKHLTPLALIAWLALPAQSSPPAPVVVHAWVRSESGGPARDLQHDQFEVRVDGEPVPLASLTARTGPASVVLLLDVTRSNAWRARPLDQQLGDFAAALDPNDHLMLATIGPSIALSPFQPATHDIRADVRRAVDEGLQRGVHNSPIWDAAYRAITVLAAQPPPRMILLLSDGRATGNRYGLIEIADFAMANGITINILLRHTAATIRQTTDTAVLVQPGVPLEALATYTGGVLFVYPQNQDAEARARLTHVAGALRALHAFTFTPPVRDGLAHRLEIRAKHPGVKVHAPLAFVAH